MQDEQQYSKIQVTISEISRHLPMTPMDPAWLGAEQYAYVWLYVSWRCLDVQGARQRLHPIQ